MPDGVNTRCTCMYIHALCLVVLCPRSLAVGEGLNVKLADFGLARAVHDDGCYHLNRQTKLPLRWMAPESIIFGIFTTQTDTWSVGAYIHTHSRTLSCSLAQHMYAFIHTQMCIHVQVHTHSIAIDRQTHGQMDGHKLSKVMPLMASSVVGRDHSCEHS